MSDHDGRGDGGRRRAASAPAGLRRARRRAVRLLHARHSPDGDRAPRRAAEPHPARGQGSARREPLPLHRLHEDPRRCRARGVADGTSGGPYMTKNEFAVIGRPLPKIDAWAKVVGETKYADDLFLPRMAYAKLLRSAHAHARIRSIDTSRARALPGVLAVVTAADLPRVKFGILPVSQDEEALCAEKVRMVGDAIAAVAAVDEETAERACRLVDIDYEPLPALMSIFDSLAHPEVRIHEYGDGPNVHKNVALQFGDVDSAFDGADLVREDVFFFEGNNHLPMEQHAAVAHWAPDGKLTLWSSTQTPHYVHRVLAKVLELQPARVRVIATTNGGAFGGKSDPFSHEIVVAKLAMLTGRPVKITLTREEVFYCHRGRHPTLMWVKTGVKKDGAITAMHFKSLLDGGGYGSYGVASTYYTGALQTVTQHVPRYKFQGARAFTNKPPCGPKRGHGTPQPRFALEVHFDKIAEQLGIDPADFRLKHLVPPRSLTANWLRIGSMGLAECLRRVVAGSGWKQKYRQLPYGQGVGLACSSYITGAGLPIYWNAMPHSGVQLKCDRGGGVTVFCGSTEIGQGSDSVLAIIVAEVLGLDPFDIAVVAADTDLTPVDLGSYSSRVTLMTGNAAIQAAERAREIIAHHAAPKLEAPVERITFVGGRVFDAASPERGISFAEAVQLAEAAAGTVGTVGSYTPAAGAGKYRGAGGGPSPAYSYSAGGALVDVAPATGIVRGPKIWIAHDVGRP